MVSPKPKLTSSVSFPLDTVINTTSPFANVLQKDGGLQKEQPYYSGHVLLPGA
jgi:hypothetical protein